MRVSSAPERWPSLPRPADDDYALARALLAREDGAPEAAWQRFASLVHSVIRAMLGPGPDVADQVQETFVRFFQKVRHLRALDSLRSFLVGIAVRVAREELRRRKLRGWLLLSRDGTLPEDEAHAVTPNEAETVALARQVHRRLQRLDADDLALFALRHVEEMEIAEIAHALGLSFSTTRRRLDRMNRRVALLFRGDSRLERVLLGRGIAGGGWA